MLSKFAKFLEYKNLLVQLLVIFIKCDHFISEDYNVEVLESFFTFFFRRLHASRVGLLYILRNLPFHNDSELEIRKRVP